ncbi:hypothetical protein ES703_25874 [subsurface metagenome]
MEEEIGEGKVKDVLKTHFIDHICFNTMINDNYDGFLMSREKHLLEELNRRIKA